MPPRPWLLLIAAIPVLSLTVSCAPPVPASIQAYNDAKNNLKFSDFDGALINLEKAIKSAKDDASRQEALVLRTALAAALADSHRIMAEAYNAGAQHPDAKSHANSFLKMRADYYSSANTFLMQAMQSVMDERSKLGDKPMPLEVAFPTFAEKIAGLENIKKGQFVSDADRLASELQQDRNCLAAVLSAIAGAGSDPKKGLAAYNTGKVDVDPRVFIVEMSDSFLQIGAMFLPTGMNQLDRWHTVNQVVRVNLNVAAKLLAAKPDATLDARVKKMQADNDKTLKKFGE